VKLYRNEGKERRSFYFLFFHHALGNGKFIKNFKIPLSCKLEKGGRSN
jgi:hypothetical protein